MNLGNTQNGLSLKRVQSYGFIFFPANFQGNNLGIFFAVTAENVRNNVQAPTGLHKKINGRLKKKINGRLTED